MPLAGANVAKRPDRAVGGGRTATFRSRRGRPQNNSGSFRNHLYAAGRSALFFPLQGVTRAQHARVLQHALATDRSNYPIFQGIARSWVGHAILFRTTSALSNAGAFVALS